MKQTDKPTTGSPEPIPLLQPADGTPELLNDPVAVQRLANSMLQCSTPIAIDAERACGIRYSARAYLVQIRRADIGTCLLDPVALGNLSALSEPLRYAEWVLHAASQDLPCLIELGLEPILLFDTELAAQLAGYPRFGLANMVAEVCGYQLAKEHSGADWSRRPLPAAWLTYAALDVELLLELRDALADVLTEQGKMDWAQQEFEHIVAIAKQDPPPRPPVWRRLSGLGQLRSRRALAVARELVEARDRLGRQRDIDVHRVLPAAAIIQAAHKPPVNTAELAALAGFRGRGQHRHLDYWQRAIDRARALPEQQLPARRQAYDGPPAAPSWKRLDPTAAARLAAVRAALADLAASVHIPPERLLAPAIVRTVLWGQVPADIPAALTELGARPWQVELTAAVVEQAAQQA